MREKLEKQLAKLKELNAKLSKRNRILILSCIAAVLIIAVGGAILLNHNTSTVLFSGLSQSEATEILTQLQDMGVTATYSNGAVSVPSNQADVLRAQLILMGHPRTGFSYDLFTNNINMMSNDFEKETYKLFDLQDRIGATIRAFRGVDDAVVFISTGNDGNYVLQKDKYDPSASVTVFMKDGGSPSPEQVSGIKLLVSSSYPGMKAENVAVVDGNGNTVSDQSSSSSNDQLGATARLKMALESQIEQSVRTKVMNLVGSIYGADRVRVAVNCNVDVKKKLTEITNYYPANDDTANPKGVLQKESTGVEAVGQGDVTYGVPGTDTNAQIPIYPNITSDGNEIYYADDKAFDYLVSQMTQQIQDDGGDVLDLSVSVVVDNDRMTRTEKEDLRQAVAMAAGISADNAEAKVSVVNAAFYQEAATGASGFIAQALANNPMLKWILLGALGVFLLLIVILVLILRAIAGRKRKKQEQEMEELRILAEAEREREQKQLLDAEDILNTPLDQVKKTREQELKQQISEFADMNPEIAAQLIKTWLKGGPSDE